MSAMRAKTSASHAFGSMLGAALAQYGVAGNCNRTLSLETNSLLNQPPRLHGLCSGVSRNVNGALFRSRVGSYGEIIPVSVVESQNLIMARSIMRCQDYKDIHRS